MMRSERVVGDCLRADPTRAVIASKFLPFPGRTSPRRLTPPSDGLASKSLLMCLADIAGAHDASISQVSLNWLLARDSHVIPIPGATKPHHGRANLDALGWRLSETEFDAIDRASAKSE